MSICEAQLGVHFDALQPCSRDDIGVFIESEITLPQIRQPIKRT